MRIVISNLIDKHKLYSKPENMKNYRNMKVRGRNGASASDKKGGVICGLNENREIRMTHRSEVSAVWCYSLVSCEGSTTNQVPRR